jgi:hypothetical protein
VAELGESAARLPEWREGGEAQVTVTAADGTVVASGKSALSSTQRAFVWRPDGPPLAAGDYLVRVTARSSVPGAGTAGAQMRVTLPAPSAAMNQSAPPRLLRRGPATGLAFVPTADARFRRVERLRLVVSLPGEVPATIARLLDRKGQTMAVPVTAAVRDENGIRVAVADATLASLAPGDYLLELVLGEGNSRQTIVTAFRIVP